MTGSPEGIRKSESFPDNKKVKMCPIQQVNVQSGKNRRRLIIFPISQLN